MKYLGYEAKLDDMADAGEKDTDEYRQTELIEYKYYFFYNVFLCASSVVEMAFNCFLLYMALRFSRVNANTETEDPILDHKVPALVCLQN